MSYIDKDDCIDYYTTLSASCVLVSELFSGGVFISMLSVGLSISAFSGGMIISALSGSLSISRLFALSGGVSVSAILLRLGAVAAAFGPNCESGLLSDSLNVAISKASLPLSTDGFT